jgi:hypothetical protein
MTTAQEAISNNGAGQDPGAREAPDRGCRSCGAPVRWARTSGVGSRCWFAICSCGIPAAYFPLRPEYEPEDPLVAAFGPPLASTRPP